jgi:hypothetical protein
MLSGEAATGLDSHTDKPYECGMCRMWCIGNYGFFTDVLDEDNYCPDCAHRITNAPSYVRNVLKTVKDLMKGRPDKILYKERTHLMVFFRDLDGALTENMIILEDFLKVPVASMPTYLDEVGLIGRLAALRLEKCI